MSATPKQGRLRLISIGFVVLVLAAFVYIVYQQWRAGAMPHWRDQLLPILGGAVGLFLFPLVMGLLWCWILRLLSHKKLALGSLMHAQLLSWLARYIPGKVGPLVGKVIWGEKLGYRRTAVVASVVYENVFFLASGISVAALCLMPMAASFMRQVPPSSQRWFLIAGVGMSVLLLLFIYLLPAFARRFAVKSEIAQNTVTHGASAALFMAYHTAHLAAGAGFYVLVTLLLPQYQVPFIDAVGIFAVAQLGGVLAVIVPAGLGAREAVLALLLLPYMPADQSVVVALIARVASLVADGAVLALLPLMPVLRRVANKP